MCAFFFCKQNAAYDMRISDWRSDVCSSDLLQIAPFAEGFLERRLRRRAGRLHALKHRALLELEPDPERHAEQQNREDERKPPAPGVERVGIHEGAQTDDEGRGEDEPEHRRRLNEAGKIGRASRRERVCQYVSISVVAVSIKNKKKTKTTK